MERKRVRDELSRDELRNGIAEPLPERAAMSTGVSVPGADPAAAIAETEGEFSPIPREPEPGADGTVTAAEQVAPVDETVGVAGVVMATDAAEGRRLQATAQ